MTDMYLRTFRIPEEDEVKAMVYDLVVTIADTVTSAAKLIAVDGKVYDDWVWSMVEDECERVTQHRDNKAYVVIRYGLHGALVGDVDPEDSPIHWFEDEVYNVVQADLADYDIDITY